MVESLKWFAQIIHLPGSHLEVYKYFTKSNEGSFSVTRNSSLNSTVLLFYWPFSSKVCFCYRFFVCVGILARSTSIFHIHNWYKHFRIGHIDIRPKVVQDDFLREAPQKMHAHLRLTTSNARMIIIGLQVHTRGSSTAKLLDIHVVCKHYCSNEFAYHKCACTEPFSCCECLCAVHSVYRASRILVCMSMKT